ncbi:MAG: hypothetical protein MUP17_06950 [candidate division Zixibacteria bacterium]|nr:hypothetical protein [candidate division Zixibacteria bacterium]
MSLQKATRTNYCPPLDDKGAIFSSNSSTSRINSFSSIESPPPYVQNMNIRR